MKKLGIVIPAYNEEKTIQSVIKRLPLTLPGFNKVQVIVVDDGSTDQTNSLASQTRAIVLRHRLNMGVGAATATGFQAAKRLGCQAMVTLDGDGQHDPKEISRILQPILEKKADVVIGTRMGQHTNMPTSRVWGNYLFNQITWAFYRVKTTDSQSGFRAYSQKALRLITITTRGYEVCTEIFGEVKKKKLTMFEVPIRTIYTQHSKSKGQPAINGVNIIFRLISRMIVG